MSATYPSLPTHTTPSARCYPPLSELEFRVTIFDPAPRHDSLAPDPAHSYCPSPVGCDRAIPRSSLPPSRPLRPLQSAASLRPSAAPPPHRTRIHPPSGRVCGAHAGSCAAFVISFCCGHSCDPSFQACHTVSRGSMKVVNPRHERQPHLSLGLGTTLRSRTQVPKGTRGCRAQQDRYVPY